MRILAQAGYACGNAGEWGCPLMTEGKYWTYWTSVLASSLRKETVESAARDVESSVSAGASDFEKSWSEATAGLDGSGFSSDTADALSRLGSDGYPSYRHPKKNWRIKQKAMPQWYKARTGVRTRAQSGAARVARFRPRSSSLPR